MDPLPKFDHLAAIRPGLASGSGAASSNRRLELELLELRRELAESTTLGRRLSSIFERAPVAIFIKSFEGVYLHANPTTAAVLGRDLDELIGRTDEELFGEAIALELRDIDQYVVTTNRPFRYEARRMTERGERVFQTTKWPWTGDDGQTSAIIAMSRDITEQKNAEDYYEIQSTVSRTLQESGSVDAALRLLHRRMREIFRADISFLYQSDEAKRLVMVEHDVARPGFGEALIEHLSEPVAAASFDLSRASVRATLDGGARLDLANRSGLSVAIAIPIDTTHGHAVVEIMAAEARLGTVRFLETLDEARLRLNLFAQLHSRI